MYGLDEGNGFRLKWTVSETSGVAGRVREEKLGGEREGGGEFVTGLMEGARKWAHTCTCILYDMYHRIICDMKHSHCMISFD